MTPKQIHLIAAARPNFMKIAPLYHALNAQPWCTPILVHTGQHYDYSMSQAFFDDLKLPDPDIHLGVGSGTHAQQTGRVMEAYEAACLKNNPDMTIVPGDVNSTLACAITAKKLHIQVAHLEAGLRSGDRAMPEEINRILTDSISDLLLTPSKDANENLIREGVDPASIKMVGNIMIDSFEMLRERVYEANLDLVKNEYAIATLHRPSNVDTQESLTAVVETLRAIADSITVVFPVHPRTKERLKQFDLAARLASHDNIRILDPLGYCDFLHLVVCCRFVITDSGGIQEESTYLGIPCITLRENTERPVTVTQGTNRLTNLSGALSLAGKAMRGDWPKGSCPELWDGKTSTRIAECLKRYLLKT